MENAAVLVSLWYAALWVAMPIVAAMIASRKGISVAGPIVISLLFGPLGIVLAWASPTDQAELDNQALLAGKRKVCPQCTERIRAKAKLCPNCATDVSMVAPGVPPLPATPGDPSPPSAALPTPRPGA